MAEPVRRKTWGAVQLNFADLNAEFDNLIDNQQDLGWPATQAKDMNGNELTTDVGGNSGIRSNANNTLDVKLNGTNLFQFDGSTGTPVNGLTWTTSIAAADVTTAPVGSDTNISHNLTGKGTGDTKLQGERQWGANDEHFMTHAWFMGMGT